MGPAARDAPLPRGTPSPLPTPRALHCSEAGTGGDSKHVPAQVGWEAPMVKPVVTAGAVSADEYERLRRNHAALRDQFEAATEVLKAVGRSAGDVDAVMTAIVESACRLCRSDAAHLYLLDDGFYTLIKTVGLTQQTIDYIAAHPMPMDRETLIGRVGLDRTTQQIPDVVADPEYGRLELQRVACSRTTMGAPLVLDGEAVGALTLWRNQVSPFDE